MLEKVERVFIIVDINGFGRDSECTRVNALLLCDSSSKVSKLLTCASASCVTELAVNHAILKH